MTPRQRELRFLAGIAVLALAVLAFAVQASGHRVAATGIGLQTLAGLFAAVQLWANNASDALIRWGAQQIELNRWYIAGLFDGRLRSVLIAMAWLASLFGVNQLLLIWNPSGFVVWPIVVVLGANFLIAGLSLFLAAFMFAGAQLVEGESLPDGKALTGLHARIAGNDWIWPIVAVTFLAGGIVQILAP